MYAVLPRWDTILRDENVQVPDIEPATISSDEPQADDGEPVSESEEEEDYDPMSWLLESPESSKAD